MALGRIHSPADETSPPTQPATPKRRRGVPTARRSRDHERKAGRVAEVVERTWGGKRHDLLGLFDALSLRPGQIVGIQAFIDGKANRQEHAERFQSLANVLSEWKAAGGGAEIHRWKRNSKGRWSVTVEAL